MMRKLISRMHGGQKGFTLIELLVVIAILGVIAAIVALNIAGFFGRGTLQAAKTEAHQAQTAIISAMADAENNKIFTGAGATPTELTGVATVAWAGEENLIRIQAATGGYIDAANYIYGPFRAVYEIDHSGAIVSGNCTVESTGLEKPWGPRIRWNTEFRNWEEAP